MIAAVLIKLSFILVSQLILITKQLFPGLFTIDPVSGHITTQRDLTGRGRTDPYRLLVGAVDGGGHTGDASLSIYIGDVSANDGVPRFIRPAPEEALSISEVSSNIQDEVTELQRCDKGVENGYKVVIKG